MDKGCKRRLRTNFTETQSLYLEEAFLESHYPDHASKRAMSKSLQIPEDRITVWFQNRRAKWRRIECREKTDRFLIKPNYQTNQTGEETVPIILKNSFKNLCNNINFDNNNVTKKISPNQYHGKIDEYNSYLTFSNETSNEKCQSFPSSLNNNCSYQQFSTRGDEVSNCLNVRSSMNEIVNNSSFTINNNMPYVMNTTSARMIFNYDDKNCFFG